jgi:hypothetical protein
MARTIGDVIAEARVLLNDTKPAPTYRYTDRELMQGFNGALLEARAKRPDLFLGVFQLRAPLPQYTTGDFSTAFPLNDLAFHAFVYFVSGWASLREDTFVEDQRAVTLVNKFVSQLLTVAS